MATRTGTIVKRDDGYVVLTWEGLAGDGDDVGSGMSMGAVQGATYQFVGDPGDDGAFQMEGSNNGTDWFILTDEEGNAISSKTAPSGGSFLARPLMIRPAQTEGEAAVTDVDCIVVAQRARA
jgi:hypothetical protein